MDSIILFQTLLFLCFQIGMSVILVELTWGGKAPFASHWQPAWYISWPQYDWTIKLVSDLIWRSQTNPSNYKYSKNKNKKLHESMKKVLLLNLVLRSSHELTFVLVADVTHKEIVILPFVFGRSPILKVPTWVNSRWKMSKVS